MTATLQEVREARADVRRGLIASRAALNDRLEAALLAGGGLLPRRDYLASCPPGAQSFALGLYDVLEELSGPERSALYGRAGAHRSTPDVWAANVAPALGMAADTDPEQVVLELVELRRAVVEYGRALLPGADPAMVSRVAIRLATSQEEADYLDSIYNGSAEESAQAIDAAADLEREINALGPLSNELGLIVDPAARARAAQLALTAAQDQVAALAAVRSRAVAEMRAAGMSHAQVAQELGISRARAAAIASDSI